jgi:hypothetical protein
LDTVLAVLEITNFCFKLHVTAISYVCALFSFPELKEVDNSDSEPEYGEA